jgi:hypothetical protein
MNCNSPDCYYRVTRIKPETPRWVRLDELNDQQPRADVYQEDIPVRDIWKAFVTAVDLLRRTYGDIELPPEVLDVYWGKEQTQAMLRNRERE